MLDAKALSEGFGKHSGYLVWKPLALIGKFNYSAAAKGLC
jgi:hypothetical protein